MYIMALYLQVRATLNSCFHLIHHCIPGENALPCIVGFLKKRYLNLSVSKATSDSVVFLNCLFFFLKGEKPPSVTLHNIIRVLSLSALFFVLYYESRWIVVIASSRLREVQSALDREYCNSVSVSPFVFLIGECFALDDDVLLCAIAQIGHVERPPGYSTRRVNKGWGQLTILIVIDESCSILPQSMLSFFGDSSITIPCTLNLHRSQYTFYWS